MIIHGWAHNLAASRVYHLLQSPVEVVSSYLTLFTLTQAQGPSTSLPNGSQAQDLANARAV